MDGTGGKISPSPAAGQTTGLLYLLRESRQLTLFARCGMVFRMKTTLIIPDPLFRKLKHRAIERGETLSNLVTEFIHRGLTEKPVPKELPPLPTFDLGPSSIDINDRDAWFESLDRDRFPWIFEGRDEE